MVKISYRWWSFEVCPIFSRQQCTWIMAFRYLFLAVPLCRLIQKARPINNWNHFFKWIKLFCTHVFKSCSRNYFQLWRYFPSPKLRKFQEGYNIFKKACTTHIYQAIDDIKVNNLLFKIFLLILIFVKMLIIKIRSLHKRPPASVNIHRKSNRLER